MILWKSVGLEESIEAKIELGINVREKIRRAIELSLVSLMFRMNPNIILP
jgi:hypothetical protein